VQFKAYASLRKKKSRKKSDQTKHSEQNTGRHKVKRKCSKGKKQTQKTPQKDHTFIIKLSREECFEILKNAPLAGRCI